MCPSRSHLCIFTTKHPFYVIKIIQLCIMLFHTSWIFTISKSQSYEYFDNQEGTTPPQSGRKKKNVLLNFLSFSVKAVSVPKILNCKSLIKECFFSLTLWFGELTGIALWLYSNSSKMNFFAKSHIIIIFLILICAFGCPKKVYFV